MTDKDRLDILRFFEETIKNRDHLIGCGSGPDTAAITAWHDYGLDTLFEQVEHRSPANDC